MTLFALSDADSLAMETVNIRTPTTGLNYHTNNVEVDNFKQSAQSSPASESEPASPAVSVTSCSDVYPSDDSEDSDVGSIHREGEEEKTAAPLEYPEMVSPEDISVSPCVLFTRSMARLHQQQRARRTPITAAVEDAYESGGADDDDDDRPLRQERRHFRLCLTSPKQDDCLESPQDTRERSPTHNVAPAKKHGLSKKSSQKKIVKTCTFPQSHQSSSSILGDYGHY